MADNGKRRTRLAPRERKRMILDEAIVFFSVHGFEGQTRQLAERLGITQPLLYRYFRNKEGLIEQVLEAVYERRWRGNPIRLLQEDGGPLARRLAAFYKSYWREGLDRDSLRLLTFAGLRGDGVVDRHAEAVRRRVLEPICLELRKDIGLPGFDRLPLDPSEMASVSILHSALLGIVLYGCVYGQALPDDLELLVERAVEGFLPACRDGVRKIHEGRV